MVSFPKGGHICNYKHTYVYKGDVGIRGPIGEPGIKGTKGEQGVIAKHTI